MGVTRWIGHTVEKIPIPDVTEKRQAPVVDQVNWILARKSTNSASDVSKGEVEIDRLVYALYGLTNAEIATVEGNL